MFQQVQQILQVSNWIKWIDLEIRVFFVLFCLLKIKIFKVKVNAAIESGFLISFVNSICENKSIKVKRKKERDRSNENKRKKFIKKNCEWCTLNMHKKICTSENSIRAGEFPVYFVLHAEKIVTKSMEKCVINVCESSWRWIFWRWFWKHIKQNKIMRIFRCCCCSFCCWIFVWLCKIFETKKNQSECSDFNLPFQLLFPIVFHRFWTKNKITSKILQRILIE